ncbi:hypothetical protein BC834DRAFT_892909 [Gloeopeniophorella convolvens]|nr:hypothetical protein BC834DRAFT_892909 [Gloeopeniophorella convolvens]
MSSPSKSPGYNAFSVRLPADSDPYYDDPPMAYPPHDPAKSPGSPQPDYDPEPSRPHMSFRSSVGLIPTPGTLTKRPPKYEPVLLRFWAVCSGAAILCLIGIGLEVALAISQKQDGFHVPEKNVFSFASTQFLTAFIPSIIIAPLGYMIYAFDWNIRMWNPYLLLSRGRAPADETLLLDYIAANRLTITYNALKLKHQFVLVSGFTALASQLFQPLAGAIFSIRQLPKTSPSSAQSISAIGLSPNVDDLSAFAASAGFAEAATFNGLSDPPFVHNGWATAEFIFPTSNYLNGSMAVNTTAIQTNTGCTNPLQLSLNTVNANQSEITAVSVDGCAVGPVLFNPNSVDQQYGVVNVPDCGSNSSDVAFQPVFFWFWQSNPQEKAGVFCTPTMQLFDVTAFASLNNGSLTNVSIIDNYPKPNNVSGPPLQGVPYNGLIFDNSTNLNIMSRSISIKTGVPNAIFRQAQQAPGGPLSVFQDPNGFLNYTTTIYTRYLALAAKSNYFMPVDSKVSSQITQLVPRLYIEPVAGHALASLLLISALVISGLHFWHWRQRRDVYLAHAPGSIASTVALTARSGFGELLMPYDDQPAFDRALKSLRFRLDRRTGAIVVDDAEVAYVDEMSAPEARDETMMTLIGRRPHHAWGDSSGGEGALHA